MIVNDLEICLKKKEFDTEMEKILKNINIREHLHMLCDKSFR